MGEASAEIRGGYETEEHPAVVAILATSGTMSAICTGSLIAPNLVLTAQHCVADIENTVNGGVLCGQTTFGDAWQQGSFAVSTRARVSGDPSIYVGVREVIVPEGRTQVCGDDVALLVLAEPISAEEAAPLVPRVDAPLLDEEAYLALGYGATDDAGSGAGVRRQVDDLTVSCVAEECPSFIITPSEWQGDKGICQGDSGGPALDAAGRVVGIASRGVTGCEDPIYGHVYAWADWLREQALHAADVGAIDPPPWATGFPTDPVYTAPTGDACTTADECGGGVCVDGACSRPCTDVATCPDGYACKASDDAEASASICEKLPSLRSDDAENEDGATCSVGFPGDDPTTPIPWMVGGALGVLAWLQRRRAR